MNRRNTLGFSAIIAFALAVASSSTFGQPAKPIKDQLVGAWSLVSFVSEDEKGAMVPPVVGPEMQGQLIFTSNGRYSFQVVTKFQKLASNDRMKTTAEENKAIAQGSFSYYGSYSVDEPKKTIILKIERSSFPNQIDTSGTRVITSLTADELKYDNPARLAGGKTHLAWKRMP